jgi:hypothetical protein
MPRFYKGVGAGIFLHPTDLRATGINSRMPGSPYNVNTIMQHVARGATTSPCISLTRSYGVAEEYAMGAGRAFPTSAAPAYVYEIDIPDPPPTGVTVIDPVVEVASHINNPLASPSYHHDGDMNFLLGVVNPAAMVAYLSTPIRAPKGSAPTPRAANLSIELETLIRALRDAEVLVLHAIPNTHVINRYDVF